VLKTASPVLGDEQLLDVELARSTELSPVRLEVDWERTCKLAALWQHGPEGIENGVASSTDIGACVRDKETSDEKQEKSTSTDDVPGPSI